MKTLCNLTLTALFFCFYSCSPEVATVQIKRNPTLNFTYDSVKWKADNYYFIPATRVIVYPADTAKAVIYNRFTLQGTGRDEKGNNLQLSIVFDAADSTHLVGKYTPFYSADKGLSSVQLYNLTDANNLAVYSLCKNDTSALLQITKQGRSERLITGSFEMTLCNEQDTTNKIHLTNGTITDIRY